MSCPVQYNYIGYDPKNPTACALPPPKKQTVEGGFIFFRIGV